MLLFLFHISAHADTLEVGPGKKYKTPSRAIKQAKDGDVIEIDTSGNYAGDVCKIRRKNLTIRGKGKGRVRIDAAGKNASGKGIWAIKESNITVENIAFCDVRVPDKNGAGICLEGGNLTVRNCLFQNNEKGLVVRRGEHNTVVIEKCEFANNLKHNLQIGGIIAKLIFRYNYTHHCRSCLLDSRAEQNFILYNYFSDGKKGRSKYHIALQFGGKAFIIGNIIHQGSRARNPTMITFGRYGNEHKQAGLYITNNTFVNDNEEGLFVSVRRPGNYSYPYPDEYRNIDVFLKNNIFAGKGVVCDFNDYLMNNRLTGRFVMDGNLVNEDPRFADPSTYDFRLKSDSPCVDRAADPGKIRNEELKPKFQYVHPCSFEKRPELGRIDIGAYECHGKRLSENKKQLVGFWPLNEGNGQEAAETTGNANKGRIVGAAWIREGNQASLRFDGVDDHVDCGISPVYEQDKEISVLLWVKPSEDITHLQGLVGRSWRNPYALYAAKDNSIEVCLFIGGFGYTWLRKDNILKPGKWNLVGFTYKDGSISIFYNGKKVEKGIMYESSAKRTDSLNNHRARVTITKLDFITRPYKIFSPSKKKLSIGYFKSVGHFKGLIRGVRIYNYALEESGVQKIYKEEK